MITIIITAYNVGKTIGRAIDSCLTLTYKNLEILIINDKSTDNTLDIINSYTDKRIRVINNKVNMGAGMSRRIGSKAAKGTYTIFLDGDDFINDDYIERMYNTAIKYKADIVSSGIRVVNEKESFDMTYDKDEEVFNTGLASVTGSETIKRYLNNKLVKRSLWKKVDYSDRRYVEDTQSCFYILFFAKKTVNILYCGYNYIQNENSLCHLANELKNYIYQALCAKDICVFVQKNNSEDMLNAMKAFLFRLKNLQKYNMSKEERILYSDELSELFTFFLKYINL